MDSLPYSQMTQTAVLHIAERDMVELHAEDDDDGEDATCEMVVECSLLIVGDAI